MRRLKSLFASLLTLGLIVYIVNSLGLIYQCLLGVLFAICVLADVPYVLRFTYEALLSSRNIKALDTFYYQGMVLPSDLDLMLHMNNSRYARETDFSRIRYFCRTGLFKELAKRKATAVLGASTFRYRRSLELFDRFKVESKIVFWDNEAVYFQHKFLDDKHFVYTIQYAKVVFSPKGKVDVHELLESISRQNLQKPKCPEDLEAWMHYVKLSQAALRSTIE